MATYGLKYRADWQNTRKQFYRLDIYQRGFSGSEKEIGTLCGCSLEIQGAQADVSAPIVKTQLRFSIIDAWDVADTATTKSGNWSEFYTPDATLYRVQLLEYVDGAWQAMWTGYITPDSWQEDLGYRTAITITARDNVGHLKDFQFDMSGNADGLVRIDDIIDRAMQKIEMAMDVTIARIGLGPESTQLITAGGTYLHEAYINADALDGMDWYQVLERTLEATGMTLRWVGKNKVEITYIRNLPNMGSPYPVPGYQTIEFYGGNLEFEPAVKQIEESVDFKFREDVSLDALGSFQYTPGSAYRCVVEGNGSSDGVVVHSAPLDVITDTDDTVWNAGSEMFNPDSREPDNYLVNAEGADGWKQYAMIPGNRDTDDPSTSFGFYTKTAAVRLSVNFAPFPVGIVDSGSDQGKVTALQYSLSSIKYQVRFEGDGITRYWSGSGWYADHEYTLTREYDSENEYGTALEISLAECKAISAGRLIVTFSNIVYKRWDDSAIGVYARVQSILVGVISTRGVTEDKVTTINNQAYNVNVSRQPLFGALSKEVGFVSPGNYQGAIFHYPNGGSIPDQYPYMVRFNGQAASRAVPLPVIIHQQILCYRYGAARVLNGRCAPIDKAAWILPSLFRYKGVSYLLQGGTIDLFSGIMEGAVLHEFVLFDDLWTGTPSYSGDTSYNTDTPGTGHSGGNSGGTPGGGGGGGTVTSVGLSMPTGFSVQGSPVTGQGTFTVAYANGYSLPTTAKQGQWDNKQDAISDLQQIRTGAGKGETAYQKPQNGIPSTDLASGVIPDVSQFITRLVNDLVNYYTKSETYTKAEVAALIGAIQTFHYEIYASTSAVTSPSNNVLYLIGPTGSGADKYEEYVYDSTKQNPWVKIGDSSIDLSGLLPKTGGTLTGDLRLKPANANYGLRIRFGDGDYVYLLEDTDDHLIIYADRGIDLNTSSGYDVTVNGVALTPADYVTKSTAQTITGEKTFTTKPVHIGSSSGIDVDGSSYIDLGDARMKWDANNHSLYVTKRPGSSYAGDINLIVDGDVGAGAPGTGVSVKYVNCANQSAYNNISPKDPGTIYTVGTAPSFSKIYLGTILMYGS